MKLTWKEVFNSDLKELFWNGQEDIIATCVISGYKYYTWNGWVYHVVTGKINLMAHEIT